MPMGKGKDAAGTAGGPRGSAREVLAVCLRLGLTSFGGPIAHLGYFHDEFVVRRRWLDEKTYADLGGALSVPARSGEQPGRYRNRPVARRLPRVAGGLVRLHLAVSHCARAVRLWRRGVR